MILSNTKKKIFIKFKKIWVYSCQMCQKSECGEICYPPSPIEVKLGPYHPEFEWFRFKKVGPTHWFKWDPSNATLHSPSTIYSWTMAQKLVCFLLLLNWIPFPTHFYRTESNVSVLKTRNIFSSDLTGWWQPTFSCLFYSRSYGWFQLQYRLLLCPRTCWEWLLMVC